MQAVIQIVTVDLGSGEVVLDLMVGEVGVDILEEVAVNTWI